MGGFARERSQARNIRGGERVPDRKCAIFDRLLSGEQDLGVVGGFEVAPVAVLDEILAAGCERADVADETVSPNS
jgi:hypothetical protein